MRRVALLLVAAVAPAVIAGSAHAAVGGLSLKACYHATASGGCAASGVPQDFARGVAMSPDAANVYLAALSSDALSIYDRAADGTLTGRGCVKDVGSAETCGLTVAGLDGAAGVAVAPDGKDVYVVSNGSDSIAALSRADDGTLAAHGCFADAGTVACGGNATQGLDGAQEVAVSPDGKDVYVSGLNDDALVRFNRLSDGSLTPGTCAGAACTAAAYALNAPGQIIVSQDSKRVWVAGDDGVIGFTRNADGSLTADRCAFGAQCPVAARVAIYSGGSSIALTPDERRLFAGGRSDDAVFTATLNASATPTYRSCLGTTGSDSCGAGRNVDGLQTPGPLAVTAGGSELIVGADGDVATPGTLQRFAVEADGDLTAAALQCLEAPANNKCPAGSASSHTTAGLNNPGHLVLAPDGATAYLSTSGNGLDVIRREVAPTCASSPFAGIADQPLSITLSCSDANAEPLTRSVVGPPSHGTVGAIDQSTGAATFTPAAGYVGDDGFTFSAGDAAGNVSNLATIAMAFSAPPVITQTPPVVLTPPVVTIKAPKLLDVTVTRNGRKRGVRVILDQPATISAQLLIAKAGRKKGSKCVVPKRALKKKCTRYVKKGKAVTKAFPAGVRSLALGSPKKGKYHVTVSARNAGGTAKTRTVSFVVR